MDKERRGILRAIGGLAVATAIGGLTEILTGCASERSQPHRPSTLYELGVYRTDEAGPIIDRMTPEEITNYLLGPDPRSRLPFGMNYGVGLKSYPTQFDVRGHTFSALQGGNNDGTIFHIITGDEYGINTTVAQNPASRFHGVIVAQHPIVIHDQELRRGLLSRASMTSRVAAYVHNIALVELGQNPEIGATRLSSSQTARDYGNALLKIEVEKGAMAWGVRSETIRAFEGLLSRMRREYAERR